MAKETVIVGLHAVEAVLSHNPQGVRGLWLDQKRKDKRLRKIETLAEKHGITIQLASRDALERMAEGVRHQGVVAKIVGEAPRDEHYLAGMLTDLPADALFLVLDGVEDPHNIGACLRTADAAGAVALIVPRDRAGGLTPTVRKVASGAAETVPLIQVTNLARALESLREAGVWVVGTALEEAAGSIYDARLSGPSALVLGAEGTGLRRLTREHCDELVMIPMQGTVQSLNVSVSAGICLFEAIRQRRLHETAR